MTERGAQPGDVEYQQQAAEAEMLLQAEEQGLRRRQLSPRQKSELIDKLGLEKLHTAFLAAMGHQLPEPLRARESTPLIEKR